MAEFAPRTLLTLEDAARLDPDRDAGEIVEGEWVPVSRNTWEHGELALNVALLLKAYARSHPGWSISVGDPGVRLRDAPATLRGPDVGMVQVERRPTGRGAEGWLQGAPDLAVEVLGDGQSTSEAPQKALEYVAAGAQMVWLLDPEPVRVVLVTPPNLIRILQAEDLLDGGEVLPGFTARVAELFAV